MSARGYNSRAPAVPKLLVVGDIALFREGIERALARTGKFEIVGAVNVRQALSIVEGQTVEVVVLDMTRNRASSQARELLAVCPSLRIVAFGVDRVDDALAFAKAGVRAFVGEDGSIETICDAATTAAQGRSVCPPELAARLLDRLAEFATASEIRRQERLTEREGQVAQMVADGLSNKQIARILSISPATVKNHVHAILGKFDLARRSAIGRELSRAGEYDGWMRRRDPDYAHDNV
jgi:DNA-binding NarL/FixJ family response regulator